MTGHKVVVELTSYGKDGKKPEGKVVEIIGHVNDPGTDIMSIVKGYDLPVEFPEKVLNQAERVAKDVTSADMAGRMDIRSWRMVTIDGEDAKDLDDAISITKEGENYQLGVHIADVTNYVQERSALDREAYERGTSVYPVSYTHLDVYKRQGKPECGFLFPAFTDRAGDLNHVNIYSADPRSECTDVMKKILGI